MTITIKTQPSGYFHITAAWRADGRINRVGKLCKTQADLETVLGNYIEEDIERRKHAVTSK